MIEPHAWQTEGPRFSSQIPQPSKCFYLFPFYFSKKSHPSHKQWLLPLLNHHNNPVEWVRRRERVCGWPEAAVLEGMDQFCRPDSAS